MQSLPARKRAALLQSLPAEEQAAVLQSLPLEKRLAGLSAEQIRQYLDQLTANTCYAVKSRGEKSNGVPVVRDKGGGACGR